VYNTPIYYINKKITSFWCSRNVESSASDTKISCNTADHVLFRLCSFTRLVLSKEEYLDRFVPIVVSPNLAVIKAFIVADPMELTVVCKGSIWVKPK